jgi:hypothetical protein
LKDREIIVDIQVRNYANTCTFSASGVYLVNDFPHAFWRGLEAALKSRLPAVPPHREAQVRRQ